jgi:hypothetical protein
MTDFVTIDGRALKQAMRPICCVVERKCDVAILAGQGTPFSITDSDETRTRLIRAMRV